MKELFANKKHPDNHERLEWFQNAKFGLFIHWGVYAQLAGSWKGKEIPGIGEQIMRFGQIPVAEYREICHSFNPTQFNAEEWVRMAHDAGMRYIVITAKHHDGFAMFHSRSSSYNIVDATPYAKDPMKDLAAACQKYGLKLCFYYSHYQDWDDPDGAVHNPWPGTHPEENKVLERYMDRKAIPQITELLTGYGPVGILWYDTPGTLSHYNAQRFNDLVHAIQPDCIVSPRVSNDELGDYLGYRDNQVPSTANLLPWETCATMNDTWGFKEQDHNWKSPATLIHLLVSIVSKGGNYLLNIGPTKEGLFPTECVERLAVIGEWMRVNSKSIYGCKGGIVTNELPFGAVTGKEDRLYLHLFDWKTGPFVFAGLRNRVVSASLLATGYPVRFEQRDASETGVERLILQLEGEAPDPYDSVIELVLEDGPVQINSVLTDYNNTIELPAAVAQQETGPGAEPTFRVSQTGIIENWFDTEDSLRWEFLVQTPGTYKVEMITFSEKDPVEPFENYWEGNHLFRIDCNRQTLKFQITCDQKEQPRDLYNWVQVHSQAGEICFERIGTYQLSIIPEQIISKKGLGPKLKSIKLIRL